MSVGQVFVSGVLLVVVPTIAGTLFVNKNNPRISLPFAWVSGQILLWSIFLIVCVPLILLEKSFALTTLVFNAATGGVLVLAAVAGVIRYKKRKERENFSGNKENKGKGYYLLWILFWVLLTVQLMLTVFMAYEEGDDAYYIAVSTITEHSDTMYRVLPYTGASTGLDARHGLAPFPVWVAWVARMTGVPVVSMAQIILPLVLIVMAYAIYYLIGLHLFSGRSAYVPFFMVIVELLILFGGYSVYTAENFLLVRTSQGKAVMANIIIPFLFYLLMGLLDEIQKQQKTGVLYWGMLTLTMMTGCLCSTLGTLLTCMFLAVVGVCAAVSFRKWKILIPMALCCVVPAGIAVMYFLVD